MTYIDPMIRYFSILGMGLVLFNALLLPSNSNDVRYASKPTTPHQAWIQASTYVPPADIGLPDRGEPGSTR
ncbi:MAG: hypothetical protein F6K30_18650 [Cyanothece sp. SIO2G6]|nr:hypothetical protein [Cyanothece sp. SIO2G6]